MNLPDLLLNVLMIGHSLFGSTNPDMLGEVLRRDRPAAQVQAQIINGAPLAWHWDHGAEAQGIDARAALTTGRFGTVILTEALPLADHVEWSRTVDHAGRYRDLAVRAEPRAQVFLQETWHALPGGPGAAVSTDPQDAVAWRDRIDRDLPVWQGIVDAVNATRDGPPMRLIPAGQAMARLSDEIARGTVPGLDSIADVFADGIHPNDLGFYFVTMVQYAVLTGTSPEGLPARLTDRWGRAFQAPGPGLAARLQRIAWLSVVDTGLAGNPPPVSPPPPPDSRRLAINLAPVADWSSEQPFLDLMKTARPWIGHRPGQWGGASHEALARSGVLDPHGWPVKIPRGLGSIGTLILTDMPEDAADLAGRYVLRFRGNGIVEVSGRATNVRYGPNAVRFDYAPGPGSVDIRIQRTDRARKGDPVRDITVVREDRVAAYDAGARFNPDWLDRLRGFSALRFMDWMKTNDSTQSDWRDRPQPGDYTYALNGVPAEVMVALANELGADPWVNMPHLATDDYVRNFAGLVRAGLAADRRVYVELSNEVWNWQFGQARWADDGARARWGKADSWLQFYAMRATEVAAIWTAVFGDQAPARLVRVISSQTGWPGLETMVMDAPLWVAEGHPRPAHSFDAYAVTGYFGGHLGTERLAPVVRGWLADSRAEAEAEAGARGMTGAERDAFLAAHGDDRALERAAQDLSDGSVTGSAEGSLEDLLTRLLPYHAAVADREGLALIMYEGGTHLVGIGPVAEDAELADFFIRVNYSAEMGTLYDRLIAGWFDLGGQLFNAYMDVGVPSKWGSWGALRHLSDTTPRWDALRRALQ